MYLNGYWFWRGAAHAGRDMPLFLAVIVNHDVATDARLALAGAHCEAETLRDDCTEVWQLFCILD